MKELTLKEAIEQGYEYCARNEQDFGCVITKLDLIQIKTD